MATRRITPDRRTANKWVKAYVSLRLTDPSPRSLQRFDDLARALSHWYDDELDLEWGCNCEACDYWRAQIIQHRANARN